MATEISGILVPSDKNRVPMTRGGMRRRVARRREEKRTAREDKTTPMSPTRVRNTVFRNFWLSKFSSRGGESGGRSL